MLANGNGKMQKLLYTLALAAVTGLAGWVGHSTVEGTRTADSVQALQAQAVNNESLLKEHTAKINSIETHVVGIEHDQAAQQRSQDRIESALKEISRKLDRQE